MTVFLGEISIAPFTNDVGLLVCIALSQTSLIHSLSTKISENPLKYLLQSKKKQDSIKFYRKLKADIGILKSHSRYSYEKDFLTSFKVLLI